jgi:hypothetical protein
MLSKPQAGPVEAQHRRDCRCAMIAGLPSSSSGPGRRPFKAVARVRIPLGVRQHSYIARSCGAVGVLAALSRRRSRVQVPSGPPSPLVKQAPPWPGSSVGTSVRLKIGRSAVRPRPWPPSLSPGFEHRPPAETLGGRSAVRPMMSAAGGRPTGALLTRRLDRVGTASEASTLTVLRVEWFDDLLAGVLVDHGAAEADDLATSAELVHEECV